MHTASILIITCAVLTQGATCVLSREDSPSQKQDWVIVFKQGPHLLLPSPDTEGGDVRSSGASASAPVKMLIW